MPASFLRLDDAARRGSADAAPGRIRGQRFSRACRSNLTAVTVILAGRRVKDGPATGATRSRSGATGRGAQARRRVPAGAGDPRVRRQPLRASALYAAAAAFAGSRDAPRLSSEAMCWSAPGLAVDVDRFRRGPGDARRRTTSAPPPARRRARAARQRPGFARQVRRQPPACAERRTVAAVRSVGSCDDLLDARSPGRIPPQTRASSGARHARPGTRACTVAARSGGLVRHLARRPAFAGAGLGDLRVPGTRLVHCLAVW